MEREFFPSEGECNIFHQKGVMVHLFSFCCFLLYLCSCTNLCDGEYSKIYENTPKQAITYNSNPATDKASTKAPIVAKVTPKQMSHFTTYKVTAYCPCEKCCGKSNGLTATGTKATAGRTIAVDPKIIPLGSKVNIGGKTFVAEDTGGAIKGRRIDMFFASHKEAVQFGVQNLPVVVVGRT